MAHPAVAALMQAVENGEITMETLIEVIWFDLSQNGLADRRRIASLVHMNPNTNRLEIICCPET